MPFAKISRRDTTIWEFERFPMVMGVYIDLFPLDEFDEKVPSKDIEKMINDLLTTKTSSRLIPNNSSKNGYYNESGTIKTEELLKSVKLLVLNRKCDDSNKNIEKKTKNENNKSTEKKKTKTAKKDSPKKTQKKSSGAQ